MKILKITLLCWFTVVPALARQRVEASGTVDPAIVEQIRSQAAELERTATARFREGKWDDAEALYRRAVQLYNEKGTGVVDSNLGFLLIDLGLIEYNAGRYFDAERTMRQARETCERVLGPDAPDTAMSMSYLGEILRAEGRLEKAGELHLRALGILYGTEGDRTSNLSQALSNMGKLHVDRREYDQAESCFQRALAIRKSILDESDPMIARTIGDLGSVYLLQGDYAKAERFLVRALAQFEITSGQYKKLFVPALNDLACVYRMKRQFGKAQVQYERALAITEMWPMHPMLATILANLAGVYYEQRRYSEAEPLLNRALSIKKKTLGPDDPSLAKTLGDYAMVLRKMKRGADADVAQRELAGMLAQGRSH